MCRHTVGLNWTAIGIEHVGTSDAAVMSNRRQLRASLGLTKWLQSRLAIRPRDVIGHSESLSSPYHHERVQALSTDPRRLQPRDDAAVPHAPRPALARTSHVAVSRAGGPVASRC